MGLIYSNLTNVWTIGPFCRATETSDNLAQNNSKNLMKFFSATETNGIGKFDPEQRRPDACHYSNIFLRGRGDAVVARGGLTPNQK